MRIVSVVGARPQFVKLAPVSEAMTGRADHVVVHTGQHYDDRMSEAFFRDLRIPRPALNLEVGSGRHGEQTGAMLGSLERAYDELAPDAVLVYGDTNSTLAAAVAAVKMHIPLVHLEAGLRSFNRRMPEEHNRVLTDHASDLLLAPSEVAMRHLETEGLASRSRLVGDVMTDVLYRTRDEVAASPEPLPGGVSAGEFYVATIHRPDNTDDAARLEGIIGALASLDAPVLLPAHPRLRTLAEKHGVKLDRGGVRLVEPLSYHALVAAVMRSRGVITDSGGLQKESFLLRVPCTTIRPESEWEETVALGWNVLENYDFDKLAAAATRPRPAETDAAPYGDGRAAHRVVDEILARFDAE
jgi:UDP-N-acetylglucosamine 2-epimerase (non-hydrolysing)